jgi:polysaccharide deacetylase 2 family uncharacterized protein YibQ
MSAARRASSIGHRSSASKGRNSRGRNRIPRAWRVLAACLAILAGAGLLTLRWWHSDAGRMWLADRGAREAQAWAQQRLEQAVLSALRTAGVAADSLRVLPRHDGQLACVQARSGAPLLDLDIAVTAAVESAAGRVHSGRRRDGEQGVTLDLTVGTPARPTLRVLVQRSAALPQPAPPSTASPAGLLAIVVDDWGYNLGPLAMRLLQLDVPLTMAILPELAYSKRALAEVLGHGKVPLLHLPMQPERVEELGAGTPAVMVGMPAAEIRTLVLRLLDGLPGVVGVNNHMGSEATRHGPEMLAVMRALDERGLFFLDSLTTPASVAYDAARQAAIPALRNDIFLDRETQDPQVVEQRLRWLIERARERGQAIGICHVNAASVQILEQVLPQLRDGEVRAVTLTDLLHRLPG